MGYNICNCSFTNLSLHSNNYSDMDKEEGVNEVRDYNPLIVKQSMEIKSLLLSVNCEKVFRVFYRGDEKYNGMDYKKALREYEYWEAWIQDEIADTDPIPEPPKDYCKDDEEKEKGWPY